MANVKITDLAALTDPVAADILEIVDDVPGTPTSKKITWANLFKAPVMTGPALGTPASGVLTNCTGLPTAGLATQVFAAGIGIGGAAADTGGIAFPATAVPSADPNTLDDYEEGTWTPALWDGTNYASAYTIQTGTYTKVGRSIIIAGVLVTSNMGSVSGQVYVQAFPFDPFGNVVLHVGYASGLAITAGTNVCLFMNSGNFYATLAVWGATTGTTPMAHTQWTADGGIEFCGAFNI